MNSNEILNKYINLIDKGYCSDCNELNCIDNFPHVKITHAIRELQQENQELKDNWNKLKKYLINDINNRNGNRVVEYEDGRKASETISPIYTLMEDKSKTIKKVLDKMQEIEQKVVE